jgi:cysteine desulfurase
MRIYLDNNATTPLAPEVRDAMVACLDRCSVGNPSSIHSAGQEARRLVDRARAAVARCIGARPEEIIFTSGGTEADNLAVLGAAAAGARRRVAASAIEHHAVLSPCRHLADAGVEVALLPVDGEGRLDLDAAAAALDAGAAVVSVMLANNDVGTIQPVAEVAALARAAGAVVHSDAVQAAGKVPVDVGALGVDLLSISAHKISGPMGAGALYVRTGTRLTPLVFGGRQERSLRPGTENVPAIVGLGRACEIAAERLEADSVRLARLRSRFEERVLETIPGAVVNGRDAPRVATTSNVAFDGLEGELLAINLDLLGVAVSTGAACSIGDAEPSHVLIAMGRTPAQARSSVRFSLGRDTTDDDIDGAVAALRQAVAALRGGGR